MDNEAKKAALIANRKDISERAFKIAETADKKFTVDAVFIGVLGTSATTVFNQYGGSPLATMIVGLSSATLIAASHINGTLKKSLYKAVAIKATNDLFEIEHRGKVAELLDFNEYLNEFRQSNNLNFSSLFNIRSAVIGCTIGAALTFISSQNAIVEARRENEMDNEGYSGFTICVGGANPVCSEIKLRTFSLN